MRAICAANLRWSGMGALIIALGCSSSSGEGGGASDADSSGPHSDSAPNGGARATDKPGAAGGDHATPASEEVGGAPGSQGGFLGQSGAATSMGGTSGRGGSTPPSSTVRDSSGGTSNGATRSGRSSTGGKAPGSVASNGGAASGGKSANTASVGGATTVGGKPVSGTNGSGGASKAAIGGGSARGGATSSGSAPKGGATGGETTPIKVFLAGDSTVQNCSSSCPCGWGSQFDALFNNNVTVVNSAVGGRSVQTWLYDANVSSTMGANGECTLTSTTYNARWTNMTNANSGMKPGDYLFIQFGINDGDSKCPRHVGSALYKTYLAQMAQAAKAAGAQPIYLTPASMIKCSGSTAVASRGFLTETKEAGVANDVPVIDLHQLSIGLYNQLKLCPESGDYTSTTSGVGRFFCADHTHFEAAGAAQIAKVIAQALRDQNIALADYLL